MSKIGIARRIIGALLLALGVQWSIMFPKTTDVLRPDFVLSVALGIGLILPGLVLLAMPRLRPWPTFFGLLLVWSLLLNLVLASNLASLAAGNNALMQILFQQK
jgi:hypothetical protein